MRSARLVASWLREPDPESKARRDEFLDHLDRRLTQLDRLSDGLIRYLRASDFDDPPAPVDLGGLIRDLQAELDLGKASRIDVSPPSLEMTLSAEPVRAVLKELIDNAIRHAGSDPVVVAVRVESEGDRYVFSVSDDGPGIAPELIPNLFQPFTRGTTGGAGMGLAIARRIVEGHGGELTVDASRPAGCGLRFSWPAA